MTGAAADLGTKEGVNLLIRDVPVVDILVNNLGIFEPKPFADITDEDWPRFFEVNVLSGVRLSRLYLPQMLQKNWGRIVFISSESAINTPVEMIHYGMTKTAQLALARGLADQLPQRAVHAPPAGVPGSGPGGRRAALAASACGPLPLDSSFTEILIP